MRSLSKKKIPQTVLFSRPSKCNETDVFYGWVLRIFERNYPEKSTWFKHFKKILNELLRIDITWKIKFLSCL